MKIIPKKTVLKNGIRLLTLDNNATSTVTVLMYFKTGSRHEDPKIQGISHFLEHMIFKGTKKRPQSLDIAKLLDQIGAEFNAFTSIDHTGYYIKAEASHIALLFDILGDMLLNSKFDEKEIAREKGPVIEEIRMYDENPQAFAELSAYLSLFGKTGVGRPIAGDENTVNGLTRKTVVEYYKTHYFAENLIVGVAGNINEEQVKKLAEKHLLGFTEGKEKAPKKVVLDPKATKIDLQHRDLKQVNAVFAFPGYAHNHKDFPALKVLQIILGAGMSSRLFISVRERQGLCYYIRASVDQFEDVGGFFIQTGLDSKRVDLAITTILQELTKMKKSGPTAQEVKDAATQYTGRIMIDMEDSYSMAEYLVSQEAFKEGGAQDLEKLLAKIKKVTPKDVKRVANDILQKQKLSLTMVGPHKDTKHFAKLVEGNF